MGSKIDFHFRQPHESILIIFKAPKNESGHPKPGKVWQYASNSIEPARGGISRTASICYRLSRP